MPGLESAECEHDHYDPATLKCTLCQLQFIVCILCSEAGGAERNVLHAAPECHEFIYADA